MCAHTTEWSAANAAAGGTSNGRFEECPTALGCGRGFSIGTFIEVPFNGVVLRRKLEERVHVSWVS